MDYNIHESAKSNNYFSSDRVEDKSTFHIMLPTVKKLTTPKACKIFIPILNTDVNKTKKKICVLQEACCYKFSGIILE
jgi:hypothetical protein